MNLSNNMQKRALLSIAVLALTSRMAIADDLPSTDLKPKNIVIAEAESTPAREVESQNHDKAVAEALQRINADNKRELELRLSGHRFILLAADR